MQPTTDQLRETLRTLYSDDDALEAVVQRLRAPELPRNDVVADSDIRLKAAADVDLQRQARCGFPEVVFGSGKPPELVVEILRQQRKAGQECLVTRVSAAQKEAVLSEFPSAIWNSVALTIRINDETDFRSGPVYVVTAGSSDRPVAEEAIETLKWMHVDCTLIQDVGVAGPHRLQRHIPQLQQAAVIVCVAGMEAALPSVLGGYVGCPVIGVPTSVGYGASLQGMTAMLAMLTCCASNVVAVNIDAGFKGGYAAGLMASRMPYRPRTPIS
jgi:pyridinium-3,5-biscarboxylic acid mononucleotide synthase